MARWGAGAALAMGCAPLAGPPAATGIDAGFVRACDDAGCACGGEGARCCEAPPRCEGALRCMGGTCQRPGPRCVQTGIFEPGFLTAEFPYREEPGTPRCSEIPRELSEPRTPGTYRAPAPAVGALECEGLAPGERTVRLRASVRALAQRHLREACDCTGLPSATLSVTLRGGATWTISEVLRYPEGHDDHQCNRGPNFDWSQRVTVGADGRLGLVVDFTGCANPPESRCLFLRGASLALPGTLP